MVDDSMKAFDMKGVFPQKTFFGEDLQHGFGVDIMGDIKGVPFLPHSIGTLLCFDTIKHVWGVYDAFEE